TGAARGDEERGQVEAWLSTGVSRVGWLAARAVGFLVAAAASIACMTAVTWLGTALAGEALGRGASALEALVVLGLALVSFALGVFVAQLFITRRAAGSVGAVVIVALFLVNSFVRSGIDVGALRL